MPEPRYSEPVQIRARDSDKDGVAGTIVGHSSTFWAIDSYVTAMAPGAFQRTLSERADRIRLFFNHDVGRTLGVPETQREDETGLHVEALLFDDGADGSLIMRHLRIAQGLNQDVYGLSFGFQRLQSRTATEDDPLDFSQMPNISRSEVEVITEVKLFEHSVVPMPANEDAAIDQIRRSAHAEALRTLLDDLTNNRLCDNERDLVRQIVAAFPASGTGSAGSPSDGSAASGPARSARRLDAEIALARLRYLTPEIMTG